MKVKYFVVGVLMAVLVIFATGAHNSESKRIQWEYAKYSAGTSMVSWKSPHNEAVVFRSPKRLLDLEQSLRENDEFIKKMGMSALGNKYSNIVLLNHVGKDCWEIVSTVKDDDSMTFYFKRPKQ